MDDNVISFTKLGTVKSRTFELTYKRFFSNLRELINNDITNYEVRYNEKEKCYIVKYDGESYIVYCGNDVLRKDEDDKLWILSNLESLVYLSERKRISQKISEELEEENYEYRESEMDRRLRVMFNAERGIFKNDKDKKLYIKILKNSKLPVLRSYLADIKNDIFFSCENFSKYREMRFDRSSDPIFITLFGGIAIIILGILGFPEFILFSGLGIIIIDDVYDLIIDFINKESVYRKTKFRSISSIFVALGKSPYYLWKIFSKNWNINKRIRGLQKSLAKTDNEDGSVKSVKGLKKEVVKEVDKAFSKENDENIIKESVNNMTITFDNLHNKVLGIEDAKIKSDLSMRLLEVIYSYVEKSKTFNDKGIDEKFQKSILDTVADISKETEVQLEKERQEKEAALNEKRIKEEEERQRQEEFQRLLDTANQVTSIRSSGK